MLQKILLPFRALYSFYALAVFFITLIPVLILYLLIAWMPHNKRLRTVYVINFVWIKVWGLLTGIIIRIRGSEHKDPKQTYVFMSNHCNLLDIPMTGSHIQHPFMPLIKKQLLNIPGLGQLFAMTSLPVDRTSQESRQRSFRRMVNAIETHTSILIFPEGTRNRTGKPLKDFYDGGFRLALHTQVPIIPVILLNIRDLQPVDTFWLSPGMMTLQYLPAVPTKGLTDADLPALKEQVHSAMYDFIVEHDRSFKGYQPVAEEA